MQQGLATAADGELILKLYELRTETVMRQARAWMTGEFWPASADEFFALQREAGSQKYVWLRQVVTYWEMAASLVLHGALSAELFVDCNSEPFFILAKMTPILPEIHERGSTHFAKTLFSKMLQLVEASQAAAVRFEAMKENVEGMRAARSADWLRPPKTEKA